MTIFVLQPLTASLSDDNTAYMPGGSFRDFMVLKFRPTFYQATL